MLVCFQPTDRVNKRTGTEDSHSMDCRPEIRIKIAIVVGKTVYTTICSVYYSGSIYYTENLAENLVKIGFISITLHGF